MSSIDFVSYTSLKRFGSKGGILPPKILSPENDETDVSPSFTLECDGYYSSNDSVHVNSMIQVAESDSFDESEIVDEIETDNDDTSFSMDLSTNVTRYIRVRYQNDLGEWSPWSSIIRIVTGDEYVETPTNEYPTDGETGVKENVVLEGSTFSVANGSDTHTESQFRLYSNGEMIHDSGELGDVIEYEVPSGVLDDGETEYEWEVRYRGETLGWSSWSTRTSFVTEDSFFDVDDDGSSLDGLSFDEMDYDENTDTGYFGEVSASTLFTGNDLASEIGLSAGTAQYSDEPWLKFYVGPDAACNKNNGEAYILYVAKKPYRYDLSWDDIDGSNAVYPNGVTVSKDDFVFNVRLLTGAEDDPHNNTDGVGSEWNELIYRIHTDEPSDQTGDNWETFTDSDIIVDSGNGRGAWCQETSADDAYDRVFRGLTSLASFRTGTPSVAYTSRGWRPALQLRP